mmetsp:Transcript_34467/g.87779  ORF Transcript_34467/g.87779 Transcript_34467/m.87779 type:complete len:238 (+) Transcript_34467:937-1650(+)
MSLATLSSKSSFELSAQGKAANVSRYVREMVYSGCCGWMFCNLRNSRWAIFCASGLSCAFFRVSRKAEISSSSSSSSSTRSSPSSPSSAPSPPFPPLLSFRISRWSSCNCLLRTVSRSSSSERVFIFELISFERRCTSTAFLTKSTTISKRDSTSSVWRTCCFSRTDSCVRPAATMSASTEGEAGQRALLLVPKRFRRKPPWPAAACGDSLRSSMRLCCTNWVIALTLSDCQVSAFS